MKLFFETALQRNVFLLTVPVGFAIGFLLDAQVKSILVQTIIDLCVLIGAGFVLVLLALFSTESTLRLYHFLGLFSGAVLYASGVGKCRKKVKTWYKQRKAGINLQDAEMNIKRFQKG